MIIIPNSRESRKDGRYLIKHDDGGDDDDNDDDHHHHDYFYNLL